MQEFELAKNGKGAAAPDFGLGGELLLDRGGLADGERKLQNSPVAGFVETQTTGENGGIPGTSYRARDVDEELKNYGTVLPTDSRAIAADGTTLPVDSRALAAGRVTAPTKTLEARGIIPTVEVAQIGEETVKETVERLATAEDRSTFKEFDALARRARAPRLTDAQKLDYINLTPDMKEMFKNTLNELEKLASGKIEPSQYMTNTMNDAVRLAEANGRSPYSWNYLKPSQAALFRDYVGMVFSERPGGFWREIARDIAGSPHSSIGSALETAYQRLTEKPTAGDSFNPNILDNNVTNSVTHHFRELFVIGFNSGKFIGDLATTQRDDARLNPGDVRNGFFASMLGNALQQGKITPREAAQLTEWAYTKHGGTAPPWGTTNQRTKWLGSSEYDIDKWMDAYKKRKP